MAVSKIAWFTNFIGVTGVMAIILFLFMIFFAIHFVLQSIGYETRRDR